MAVTAIKIKITQIWRSAKQECAALLPAPATAHQWTMEFLLKTDVPLNLLKCRYSISLNE